MVVQRRRRARQPALHDRPNRFDRQSLAVLPDGEIVVAQVENNDEVEVQRYDTHGNPIGSEILPPSDGNAVDPESTSVTVMPNGGFAVTWEFRHFSY